MCAIMVLNTSCILSSTHASINGVQPIVDNGKLAEGDGIGDGVGAIRFRVAVAASDPIHLSS